MCKKVKFKSEAIALKHGKGGTAYYCFDCMCYHTTSMSFAKYNKKLQKQFKYK